MIHFLFQFLRCSILSHKYTENITSPFCAYQNKAFLKIVQEKMKSIKLYFSQRISVLVVRWEICSASCTGRFGAGHNGCCACWPLRAVVSTRQLCIW